DRARLIPVHADRANDVVEQPALLGEAARGRSAVTHEEPPCRGPVMPDYTATRDGLTRAHDRRRAARPGAVLLQKRKGRSVWTSGPRSSSRIIRWGQSRWVRRSRSADS